MNEKEARKEEKRVHKILRSFWDHGEWFYYAERVHDVALYTTNYYQGSEDLLEEIMSLKSSS